MKKLQNGVLLMGGFLFVPNYYSLSSKSVGTSPVSTFVFRDEASPLIPENFRLIYLTF